MNVLTANILSNIMKVNHIISSGMSLTIINGANIVARSVIRRLAPLYQTIKLCDYKPYRPSVLSPSQILGLHYV